MTSPLSPTPSAQLNFATPPTTKRYEKFDVRSYTATHSSMENIENEEGDSSPFVTQVEDENKTNLNLQVEKQQEQDSQQQAEAGDSSPSKRRAHSRILSGTELSPLKILQHDHGRHDLSPSSTGSVDSIAAALASPTVDPPNSMPPPCSVRKHSAPIKRFPVRISQHVGEGTPRASPVKTDERHISLEEAMRENVGLKHAIDIFEDEVDVSGEKGEINDGTVEVTATVVTSMDGAHDDEARREHGVEQEEEDEAAAADDTMISTFSTFSAVPNLTMFSRMRDDSTSPVKSLFGDATPRAAQNVAASSQRTPRPCMPRSTNMQQDSGGNTTNLIDFTEQLRFGNYPQATPSRRGRMSPSKTTANFADGGAATIAATPQQKRASYHPGAAGGVSSSLGNLLDFDIPPLPTPRSIPTITPRELESLKSGFLSEISSLKASLSGKEAEVSSLKTAVGDAEKRVGECMEQLREVKDLRDSLEAEKDGWEKRGREMESVLRKVKEEIVMGQRDREELEFKLDESEKRREMAEMMAQEAESKMAGMRAGKAAHDAGLASPTGKAGGGGATPGGASNKEVELAVERVARELHALYKSKHETKVAALKKSYETRWEKKVRELQVKVDELARENEELRVGRDATLTHVDPAKLSELERERKAEKARDAEHIAHLTAEVEKLEAFIKSMQADNAELRTFLERERVEKGELVQLAEEMMSMQQSFVAAPADDERGATSSSPSASHTTPRPNRGSMPPPPRPSSMGYGLGVGGSSARNTPSSARQQPPAVRASGLRAPGGLKASSSESRIGRGGLAKSSAASGVPRPGSGLAVRSGGLMSSIEKMGNYGRGRGGNGE